MIFYRLRVWYKVFCYLFVCFLVIDIYICVYFFFVDEVLVSYCGDILVLKYSYFFNNGVIFDVNCIVLIIYCKFFLVNNNIDN